MPPNNIYAPPKTSWSNPASFTVAPFLDNLPILNKPPQAEDINPAAVQFPIVTQVPLLAPRKSPEFGRTARLSTLPSKGYSSSDDNIGKIVIWLPHLPEEIQLARENNYDQAGNNPLMPDGLYIYQNTNPLEIPLSFTLHAFDDLCVDGPQTLLDIAAKLHALTLPASNQTIEDKAKTLAVGQSLLKGQSNELRETTAANSAALHQSTKQNKILYPPACALKLIQAGVRGLGINCVGFVKRVSVTLVGPYLQTTDGSDSFNLPSAAKYEFTFVHNPVYTNTLEFGQIVQAYGPDIFSYFYNTAHLAPLAKNTYVDVADLNRINEQG